MIKTLSQADPRSWEEHLPTIVHAMNTSVCRSTGHAPFELMFGRHPATTLDLLFGDPPNFEQYATAHDYAKVVRARVQAAHEWARKNIGTTVSRQRKAYYKNKVSYSPGDKVWLFTPRSRGVSRKLTSYWSGPWTVTSKINDVMYRLQSDPAWEQQSSQAVSIDRLKPYGAPRGQGAATSTAVSVPPDPDADLAMQGDEHAEAVDLHDDVLIPDWLFMEEPTAPAVAQPPAPAPSPVAPPAIATPPTTPARDADEFVTPPSTPRQRPPPAPTAPPPMAPPRHTSRGASLPRSLKTLLSEARSFVGDPPSSRQRSHSTARGRDLLPRGAATRTFPLPVPLQIAPGAAAQAPGAATGGATGGAVEGGSTRGGEREGARQAPGVRFVSDDDVEMMGSTDECQGCP